VLRKRLGDELARRSSGADREWFQFNAVPAQVLLPNAPPGQTLERQQAQVSDFEARARAVNRAAGQGSFENAFQNPVRPAMSRERIGPLIPLWLEAAGPIPLLVLVRRVRRENREALQGVLVDWAVLKAAAEEEVKDLFPSGALVPFREGPPRDPDRTLAVIPAALDPGARPDSPGPALTPIRAGLGVLWIGFLAVAGALGFGLRGLLDLNRRRLEFVSAVTHELRTPLTTFTMYSEMLKEGMVPPGKEGEYFAALHEESLRLSHLVQNVLDFSRLESRRVEPRKERAPLERHLERILPLLEARCARAGRPFRFASSVAAGAEASLDAAALGQILFNLADNACKYGKGAVTLSAALEAGRLRFEMADEGPGVDSADAGRLFAPFFRGKASGSGEPGVGLGLALCLRWAREMGGDLLLLPGPGARFALDLPAD
ncbi:MAG: HAMP domain-containing histidine kinase, partial [Planctomycetes bacterium]|nr:HAMP domain-containing histidine kinase [Planctomycetota bacterium]